MNTKTNFRWVICAMLFMATAVNYLERGWLIALAGCLLLTLLPQDGGLRPWRLLPIAAAFVLLAAG